MALSEEQNEEIEQSKMIMKEVARKDGKLKSPIDLVMGVMKPLCLERIKWMNFEDTPRAMKVTNSGETVIISAKWAKETPSLMNGPLDGNYVFSQAHFHWGSQEGEGSEHTVNGVSYPMEMHVLFFKAQYLTQEAAIKEDDGIVIIAYLIRVDEESTPGLRGLSAHLERVLEPLASAFLPPFALSSLLAPTTQDYALYWGSVSGGCSHTIQWLVSRSALGISEEDLNKFRKVLNFKKEPIVENFRTPTPASGQTVFHVNPSTETEHFLLPGTFCFSGQSQTLNEILIKNQLVEQNEKTVDKSKIVKGKPLSKYKHFIGDHKSGVSPRPLKQILRELSNEGNTPTESCSLKTNYATSPFARHLNCDKVSSHLRKQCQSRGARIKKLASDKERRQELEKKRLKMIRKREESTGEKAHKLEIKSMNLNNESLLPEKVEEVFMEQKPVEGGDVQNNNEYNVGIMNEEEIINTDLEDLNVNKEIIEGHNVEHSIDLTKDCTELLINKSDDPDFHVEVTWSTVNTEKASDEVHKENIGRKKPRTKSKLPRPVHHKKPVIQSSLVQYFTKCPNKSKKQPQLDILNMSETINVSPRPKSDQDQVKRPTKKYFQRLQAVSPNVCNKTTDL